MAPLRSITLALLVLFNFCCPESLAQGTDVDPKAAVELANLRVFQRDTRIDIDVNIAQMDVSPDGSSIYIYTEFNAANVWAWLMTIWPRVAIIPGAIVLFILMRRLIRAARNPQHPGEPYCAKCSYVLKGSQSGKCPECGVSLSSSPPRIGKSQPRRLAPGVAWTIGLVFLLIILNAAMPQLPKSVATWFDWPSRGLAQSLLDSGDNWTSILSPKPVDEGYLWNYNEIWKLDAASGKVIDAISTDGPVSRQSDRYSSNDWNVSGWDVHGLAVASDGRNAFLRRVAMIEQFDLTEGTLIRTYTEPDDSSQTLMHDMGSESVVLSQDGKTVFTANGFNEAFAWNIDDGKLLADAGVDIVRFVNAPTNPDDPPFYHLWDITDQRRRVFVFTGDPVSGASAAVSADGSKLYKKDIRNQIISVFDVATGAITETIEKPAGITFIDSFLAYSSRDHLLAVTGVTSQLEVMILIRDLRAGKWVARLAAPENISNHLKFSADGRRLFLCGDTANSAYEVQSTVLIYDMDAIAKQLDRPAATAQP